MLSYLLQPLLADYSRFAQSFEHDEEADETGGCDRFRCDPDRPGFPADRQGSRDRPQVSSLGPVAAVGCWELLAAHDDRRGRGAAGPAGDGEAGAGGVGWRTTGATGSRSAPTSWRRPTRHGRTTRTRQPAGHGHGCCRTRCHATTARRPAGHGRPTRTRPTADGRPTGTRTRRVTRLDHLTLPVRSPYAPGARRG